MACVCLAEFNMGNRAWTVATIQLYTYYQRSFTDPAFIRYMVRIILAYGEE